MMNTRGRTVATVVALKVAAASTLALGMVLSPAAHGHAQAIVSHPACESYPGPMPDALCAWLDPRTGDVYVDGPNAMARCVYEDGNPDGMPCVWWSPRTGLPWFNTSETYR